MPLGISVYSIEGVHSLQVFYRFKQTYTCDIQGKISTALTPPPPPPPPPSAYPCIVTWPTADQDTHYHRHTT